MAKSQVYNINAIRQALIQAHNSGNKRNLTRDFLEGAGIQGEYFTYWQNTVEVLRTKVVAYVDLAWNQKFDSKITKEQLAEAREAIYPAYKDILSQGEPDKETKKLHVDETDVERLIKFAWNFTAMGGATSMIHVDKKHFRLEVEKLLGCIIAKGEILTDSERDKLTKYNKAVRTVEKSEKEKTDLQERIKFLDATIAAKVAVMNELKVPAEKQEELLKEYNEIKTSSAAKIKDLDEKISSNSATVNELSADVKKIRLRLQFAG